MSIDQFIASQAEEMERFRQWWNASEWANLEMQSGDWIDQFNLWVSSQNEIE